VTGVPNGTLFLRDDFTWQAAGGGLTSGAVQSGHVASGAVQGFFGATNHIASGTIGSFDFGSGAVIAGAVGSGAVVSGNIASGQIGFNHLASGSVGSGAIASGQVTNFKLASGAVNSGHIAAAGTPTGGQFLRDDFTWAAAPTGLSGVIGSGSIASGMFASGLNYQGYPMTQRSVIRMITSEVISGCRAVNISISGLAQIAKSNLSGCMPAIGFYDGPGVAAGAVAEIVVQGIVQAVSGVNCTRPGRPVWVNASGYVGTISGGFLSGGFGANAQRSGTNCQCLGVAINSGAIFVQPIFPMTSGLPLHNAGFAPLGL
jgi:hypothetical protein